MDSLLDRVADVEPLAVLSQIRLDFHACLTARADELSELADAVLCADGPVRTLAGLSLAAGHRRGHGALYDAVNHGRIDIGRLRRSLAAAAATGPGGYPPGRCIRGVLRQCPSPPVVAWPCTPLPLEATPISPSPLVWPVPCIPAPLGGPPVRTTPKPRLEPP